MYLLATSNYILLGVDSDSCGSVIRYHPKSSRSRPHSKHSTRCKCLDTVNDAQRMMLKSYPNVFGSSKPATPRHKRRPAMHRCSFESTFWMRIRIQTGPRPHMIVLPGYSDRHLALTRRVEQVPALHVAYGVNSNYLLIGWNRRKVVSRAREVFTPCRPHPSRSANGDPS